MQRAILVVCIEQLVIEGKEVNVMHHHVVRLVPAKQKPHIDEGSSVESEGGQTSMKRKWRDGGRERKVRRARK